jgi:aryl-alcohol dehydrogenase-like predicted oxidoreductase
MSAIPAEEALQRRRTSILDKIRLESSGYQRCTAAHVQPMLYRPLANTGLQISEVSLGCWPIAGMTSPGINDADSIATIRACFDLGINHVDTAYCYGAKGESERLIARALGNRRKEIVIATKGGIHWSPEGKQVFDARPATLRSQCEESLRRLGTHHVELYYLHAPDKRISIAESAGELKRLLDEGKILAVGVSNVSLAQLQEFAAECPLTAFQPPYNMLVRQIEADTLPWCRRQDVAVLAYWPLMKGLLAGKIAPNQVFGSDDSRHKYPMFQGEERRKNHDLVDRLTGIARDCRHTTAELVIRWTLQQPGITCTLCGARRPDQIRENAAASGWQLNDQQLTEINRALAERGESAMRSPV